MSLLAPLRRAASARAPIRTSVAKAALVAASAARPVLVGSLSHPLLSGAPRAGLHASAATCGKIIQFNLPDIGEGIAEVEVLAWHVKEGDSITQFQKLLDVQSDKASVEMTSRYDGVIRKIYHKVGEMAATGKPLMDIELAGEGEGDAAPAAGGQAAAPAAGAGSQAAAAGSAARPASGLPADHPNRTLATPAVRRVAREHGIDISALSGSGKDGRVTKEDVLSFIAAGGKAQPQAQAQAKPAAAPAAPAAAAAAPAAPSVSHTVRPVGSAAIPADTRVPVKGLARTMVKTMTAAWSVPHFGYCDEVSMDQLVHARAALKAAAEARGLKFSFLPFILKATSLALAEFPSLNAHVAADVSEVVHKGSHNIGIAMDTPRGLIVPNIKAVQERSLLDIAAELNRLQGLASAGKLEAGDLADGTFTLSNIGAIGGTYASPVLSVPQVAIGALGKISRVPRFAGKTDTVVAANIMTVSWAADHRVVDGATMARFSNAWKGYLESPVSMLAHLR